jgi:hypothetical protein
MKKTKIRCIHRKLSDGSQEFEFKDVCEFMNDIKFVRQFLEKTTGMTYPLKTLKRRLGLLNTTDRKGVISLEKTIVKCAEEIDEIISYRADIEGDKWP